MTPRQRPSLLSMIIRAPFFMGFLVLVYFLGRSLLNQISGFALALGFPAITVRYSAYALGSLFIFIIILVLIQYLSSDD